MSIEVVGEGLVMVVWGPEGGHGCVRARVWTVPRPARRSAWVSPPLLQLTPAPADPLLARLLAQLTRSWHGRSSPTTHVSWCLALFPLHHLSVQLYFNIMQVSRRDILEDPRAPKVCQWCIRRRTGRRLLYDGPDTLISFNKLTEVTHHTNNLVTCLCSVSLLDSHLRLEVYKEMIPIARVHEARSVC